MSWRRLAAGTLWLALLGAAGCRVGAVTAEALRGPVPAAVLVLPPVDRRDGPPRPVRHLASGADTALRARGYRALPLDIGFDLAQKYGFRAAGDDELAALQRLSRQAGVDAVLLLTVAGWDVDGERGLRSASWDFDWQLIATADGALLWQHGEHGSWQPSPGERLDPMRQQGDGPRPVTLGGAGRQEFRSELELIAALQRTALARLPERPQ